MPVIAVTKTLDMFSDPDSIHIAELEAAGFENLPDEKSFELFRLFYEHFNYRILSSAKGRKSARFKVRITNIDTRALASDMRLIMLKDDISSWQDTLSLMEKLLSENDYPLVDTEGEIYAVKTDRRWSVNPDKDFNSFITGSVRQHLQDPYILSSDEVLSVYLDELESMTAEEWKRYFGVEDLFSTYAANYKEIDSAFMSAVADNFSYTINQIDEEGSESHIDLEIRSIDMNSLFDDYKRRLMEYAGTVEASMDDSAAAARKAADCLLEALQDDPESASFNVTVHMINDGSGWKIEDKSVLSEAILGNISEAAAAF